jgi:beta-glucosidase
MVRCIAPYLTGKRGKEMVRVLFVMFLLVNSVSYGQEPTAKYLNPNLPIEERIDDLMGRMTLREKCGQMDQFKGLARMKKDELTEAKRRLRQGLIGSFLSVKEAKEVEEIQKLAEKSPLKIPILIAIDAIHGHCYYSGTTIFPSPIGMASTWNPEIIEQASAVTAKEMRVTGYHWNFSPYINVTRDPRWGRTGENFGEDPFLVSAMGVAMVRGYQGKGISEPYSVLACAKTFLAGSEPVNGLNQAPVDISERTMREIFLPPFQACIDAGAWTVMADHSQLHGEPCHSSKKLMTDILRGEMGFKGFVVSDWMDIEKLYHSDHVAATPKEAVRMTVSAGVDMHMHGEGFLEPLEQLVREGAIPESHIDRVVRVILDAKFRLGLFENRYVDQSRIKKVLACREHKNLALQIARESIVLLKNEKLLLPLDKNIKSIFITGPNANSNSILGDWVTSQPSENIISILQGLRNNASSNTRIDYYPCGKIGAISDKDIRIATQRAQKANVAVLVIGGNSNRCDDEGNLKGRRTERTSGENIARSDIGLVGRQLEMVKAVQQTGTPVIAVLINGRPLAIEWITENIPAIVEAWEPGMEAGQAVAEVLFGDYNPGGKLPISILRGVGHIPYYYNHNATHNYNKYKFGKTGPLYEFGHGLSYTSFSYQNLRLPKKISVGKNLNISVEVKNTGKRAGDEVVQVYTNDVVSSIVTPVKELKAFKRITIQPGEKRKLEFTITSDQLALFDQNMKRVVEPGIFQVMVGDLMEEFEVVGN